jgi:hypothetical protein
MNVRARGHHSIETLDAVLRSSHRARRRKTRRRAPGRSGSGPTPLVTAGLGYVPAYPTRARCRVRSDEAPRSRWRTASSVTT